MAITVRLSEEERSRFGAAAGRERLSISEWLRQLGNGVCDLADGAPLGVDSSPPSLPVVSDRVPRGTVPVDAPADIPGRVRRGRGYAPFSKADQAGRKPR